MTQTRELFTEDDLAILFVAYQSALNANATTEANAINSLRERVGSWIADYRWPPESPTHPDAPRAEPVKPYRIWALHAPFRKNGTPVLGTMGSTIRGVIIIEAATWKRLCADVPQLQTTQFEVGHEG